MNNNKNIIGYDQIEENLWQNFLNNKLHHCNLISGIRGNGKASFIKKFATKIISHNQTITQNIKNHPDILIIEGQINKNGQNKILIDDIRKIKDFANLSSGIAKNKIIIIDAVDDMNNNAYNALLKTIEEPRNNIFIFLINHNIRNISDTIKSRSNIIKIKKFNFDNWSLIIKNQLKNTKDTQLKQLYLISPDSIRKAILLHQNQWLDIYKNFILLLTLSDEIDIIDFCETNSLPEMNFDIFTGILDFFLLRIIKIKSCRKLDLILEEESVITSLVFNVEKIFLLRDKILVFLNDARIFNLNQKYSILNIILLIKLNSNQS